MIAHSSMIPYSDNSYKKLKRVIPNSSCRYNILILQLIVQLFTKLPQLWMKCKLDHQSKIKEFLFLQKAENKENFFRVDQSKKEGGRLRKRDLTFGVFCQISRSSSSFLSHHSYALCSNLKKTFLNQ